MIIAHSQILFGLRKRDGELFVKHFLRRSWLKAEARRSDGLLVLLIFSDLKNSQHLFSFAIFHHDSNILVVAKEVCTKEQIDSKNR